MKKKPEDRIPSIEDEVLRKVVEARPLARYMSSTQDLVEEQIRKAAEKGEFDNLPGMGMPLDLEENPYEPPELRMVFRILRNNDFAPHWVEIGKEIDGEFDKIDRETARFERYVVIFFTGRFNEAALKAFERKKELFYMEQKRRLENLYMRIVDFNLHCPTFKLGRANLETVQEYDAIVERIEAKISLLRKPES